MKKSSQYKHLQRRILTLHNASEARSLTIRCVEESLSNYWGYPTDRAPLKVHRFPKTSWEVLSDKTK